MATLPEDLLRSVFSYLPKDTLLNCRLLDRATGALATTLAFRHVHIKSNLSHMQLWTRIAASSHLGQLVREVTIDARAPDASLQLNSAEHVEASLQHGTFLATLPQFRFFSGLHTIHVSMVDAGHDNNRALAHLSNVLVDVLHKCIAGLWNKDSQRDWCDRFVQEVPLLRDVWKSLLATADTPSPPLAVSSLDVSRLIVDCFERDYTDMNQRALFPLTETLKLLFSTYEFEDERMVLANKYFAAFPSLWFAPPVAANLRTLSLFHSDYFGWAPKLDFRLINPGCPSGGLPKLRVLALGKFTFSHDWQIDWISSLGKENGYGGLQELYLDDCPIMWRAHTPGPLDESVTTLDNGFVLDNHGYSVPEAWSDDDGIRLVTLDVELRWSRVLDTWCRDMHALRVFRMGSGNWDGDLSVAHPGGKDAVHLTYDDPNGFWEKREHVLQYVHFEHGRPQQHWVERDFQRQMVDEEEDGWERYQAMRTRDEESLRDFQAMVASRS